MGSFLVPVGLITLAGFTFSSGSGGFGGITTTSVINVRSDLIRVSKICFCAASCSKIGCSCSEMVDVSNGNNCDKLTSCGSGLDDRFFANNAICSIADRCNVAGIIKAFTCSALIKFFSFALAAA